MDKVQEQTAQLIKSVAEKSGISEEQARTAVDTVIDYVKNAGLPGADTLAEYAEAAKDKLGEVAGSIGGFFQGVFGGSKEEPKEGEDKK